MTADRPEAQIPQPAPVPRLLVELPPWRQAFLANLRDALFPRHLAPLELHSAPAPFWHDVFVKRPLPWNAFLKSGACHFVAFTVLVILSRFIASQPQPQTFRDHWVAYYQPSEYLPPIDTRSAPAARPRKAQPQFSRQPIISVPAEPDNRAQTIVTPPNVKLKRDVALPNIVAWSDKLSDKIQKPRLDIPAPLTPAADITRIAPKIQNAVAAPPPDAAHLTHNRVSPTLQNSVVAPPPDLRATRAASGLDPLLPAVIAPPPSVEAQSSRPLSDRNIGDLNIARSAVIAPAPQLAVGEERTVRGGGLAGPAQIVPPPPSLSGSSSSGQSMGSPGRVIALNLHPVVGAPPDPPPGNRRGAFAATPEGRAGAPGSPGSTAGDSASSAAGGSTHKGSDLPAGLYVGKAGATSSPVAGVPAPKTPVDHSNPNLIASVRSPRVTNAPTRPTQSDSAAKLSEAERAVFGDRKFYSLTLNMPNLNSAGGSWVIRFAEMNRAPNAHNQDSTATDLSQPMPTRKVDPAYPIQLMKENVAGTVILYAIIHADGTVGNVRVLRGVDNRLDLFASQAVAQWQFQPATKNGAPVDVEATFQIPFRPSRVGTNF